MEIKERSFLETISTNLEVMATICSNISSGLDHIAANLYNDNCYPTIKSIRFDIQDHIQDMKGVMAQLNNADAELQKIENESNQ